MGYLVADSVNDYCTIPNALTGNAGTDPYTLEFSAAFPTAPAADRFLIGVGSGTTSNGFQITTGGRLQVWTAGTNRYFTAPSFILFDSTIRTYRLEHDAGGAWRAYRNGTLFGSGTFSTSAAFTALGLFFRIHPTSSGYLGGNFEYIETTGLGNSARWSADLSGGTGSTWPTVSGTNNATLNNFPTDNSQWQGFSSAIALDAAITCTSSLTASLTTQIPLAAAMSSSSSLGADLTTSIALQTNIVTSSTLTAELRAGTTPLSADIQSTSSLTANLSGGADTTTVVPLVGFTYRFANRYGQLANKGLLTNKGRRTLKGAPVP